MTVMVGWVSERGSERGDVRTVEDPEDNRESGAKGSLILGTIGTLKAVIPRAVSEWANPVGVDGLLGSPRPRPTSLATSWDCRDHCWLDRFSRVVLVGTGVKSLKSLLEPRRREEGLLTMSIGEPGTVGREGVADLDELDVLLFAEGVR